MSKEREGTPEQQLRDVLALVGVVRDNERATRALTVLLAERDGLRKDAERYRWLRTAVSKDFPDANWWDDTLANAVGDDFDTEVDAAIATQT